MKPIGLGFVGDLVVVGNFIEALLVVRNVAGSAVVVSNFVFCLFVGALVVVDDFFGTVAVATLTWKLLSLNSRSNIQS